MLCCTSPPALKATLQFLSQRKLQVWLAPPEREEAKGLTDTSPHPHRRFFFLFLFFLRVHLQSWSLSEALCHCGAVLRPGGGGLPGPKEPVKGRCRGINKSRSFSLQQVNTPAPRGAGMSLVCSRGCTATGCLYTRIVERSDWISSTLGHSSYLVQPALCQSWIKMNQEPQETLLAPLYNFLYFMQISHTHCF